MQLESDQLQDNNSILIAANRGESGIINLKESEANVTGKVTYFNNSGTFLISNSKVRFFNNTIFNNCTGSTTRTSSIFFPEGGAVTSMGSKIWFYDSVTFLNNYSNNIGGGFCAVRSEVYILKSILISKNQAKMRGSGIFLYKSNFVCISQCNISENGMVKPETSKGGGIYAFDSKIVLGSNSVEDNKKVELINVSLVIKGNFATKGGGIYLEANSRLIIPKDVQYRLIFEHNHASEGKVIYIDDDTYLGTCEHYVQCFLQVSLLPQPSKSVPSSQIQIVGNVTETTIFGGLLNKCFVNNEFNYARDSFTTGIDYLKTVMTNNQSISRLITSKAVRIQFCQIKSTVLSMNVYCKKGEKFTVEVRALDQVNHTVNATISSHLNLSRKYSYLKENQYSQTVSAECSNLSFNVYSLKDTEVLSINPETYCSYDKEDDRSDTLQVNIIFKKCTCPVGFYALNQLWDCRCVCDPKIFSPHAELIQIECNFSTVVKKSQYWIGYNKYTGFLFHPFCPYDFCLPPDTVVTIDLNLKKWV